MIGRGLYTLFLLATIIQIQAQSLQKIWETDTLFSKPESAVYDQVEQIIFVSNVNGKYCTKDGNGFISKVNLKGEIIDLKWIDGLDSPQGLALSNGKLYVADVDNVVEIDIQTLVVKKYPVKDALFLNDAAADKQGNVFFSDCKTNKVHKLKNGQVTIFMNDSLLKGTNGLLFTGNNCFVISGRTEMVYRFDCDDKVLYEFTSGIKNGDGIVSDGEGGYFVSGAWQGQLFHLNNKGEKRLVLDLGDEKTIVADITYLPEKRLLLIPTLKKTLLAYSWTQ